MKKKLSIILFICLLPNLLLTAQKSSMHNWFCIKMEIVNDRITKGPIYKIVKSYPEIKSGSQADFIKALQINLKKNLVTMGSFTEKSNAQFAQKYFEKLRYFTAAEMEVEIQNDKSDENIEVYSYTSKIYFKEKTRAMFYERTAAAVYGCSIAHFKLATYEGLTTLNLFIGPFSTRLEAETAKFYQRLYGEEISSWQSIKNSEKNLQEMSDNFESIVKSNLSVSTDSLSKPASYNINLKIPPKYFDKYSMLVLSFNLIYENKETTPVKQQTIQGEQVEDNNPVIVQNEGGVITERFPVTDKRIDKIRIRSTFLNSNYLIEGTEVILAWPINLK